MEVGNGRRVCSSSHVESGGVGEAGGGAPLHIEAGGLEFFGQCGITGAAADPEYRRGGEVARKNAIAIDGRHGIAAQGDAGGPQVGDARDGIEDGGGRLTAPGNVDVGGIDGAALDGLIHGLGRGLHARIDGRVGGQASGRDDFPAQILRPGLPLRGFGGVQHGDRRRFTRRNGGRHRKIGLRARYAGGQQTNCGACERGFS